MTNVRHLIQRTAARLLRPRPILDGATSNGDKPASVPRHVVIIPDGNRRWAKSRGLPAIEGHRRGAQAVEDLVWGCRASGVSVLTLWGFSTENWKRSGDEVEYLMDLFLDFLHRVESSLHSERVRFMHLGRKDRLPAALSAEIARLERETADYGDYYLNLCLDYGGRDEIVRAVRRAMAAGVDADKLDEETLAEFLDTAGLPDPDLIIRTSGEFRLSGILPFQSVYSELAFVPVHLPDMTRDILDSIFEDYARRKRRFGE